tara:strand:- start:1007 stop:1315 length:309 start_codon:yes stop_codon:yes gene_type:complete
VSRKKISIFAGNGRINADMAFKHHMHSAWRASNQRTITCSKSTTKATRGGWMTPLDYPQWAQCLQVIGIDQAGCTERYPTKICDFFVLRYGSGANNSQFYHH